MRGEAWMPRGAWILYRQDIVSVIEETSRRPGESSHLEQGSDYADRRAKRSLKCVAYARIRPRRGSAR
eukprot:5687866-Prymnesium_polylepis.1